MRPSLLSRFGVFCILLLVTWWFQDSVWFHLLAFLIAVAGVVVLFGLLRHVFRRLWTRLRDQYTESPLERAMARELFRQNISFVREHRISNIHVDFALLDHKIAIECDGWRYHKNRQEKDVARDAFLRRRGWRVLRFSGARIRADVRGCVREIREIIENDSVSASVRS